MNAIKSLCLALALAAVAAVATAQTYPNKPVRIIVSYAPGGGVDLMTRMVAQKLTEQTGQSFIVDNRAGAAGTIGAAAVAKADPDGYTVLSGGNPEITLMPHMMKGKLPYDALKDLAPVTKAADVPSIIVANAAAGITSLKEAIERAKGKPGSLSYGTPGAGTPTHLAMEFLKEAAGVDITHVPYKGGGPASRAVVSGEVPLAVVNAPPLMPFLKQGKLKALAVMNDERSPLLPDVPTVKEAAGIDRVTSSAWFGFSLPSATPAPIRDKLEAELRKALADPALNAKLTDSGMVVSGMPSKDFAEAIRAESALHAQLLAKFGKRPE